MRAKNKGFTLIEVIIASMIFFISIAVISQIFGLAFNRANKIKTKRIEALTVLNKLTSVIEKYPIAQERKSFKIQTKENNQLEEIVKEEEVFYCIINNDILFFPKIRQ